eukprot:10508739-Alexandrium_andersonii.AAC.1
MLQQLLKGVQPLARGVRNATPGVTPPELPAEVAAGVLNRSPPVSHLPGELRGLPASREVQHGRRPEA